MSLAPIALFAYNRPSHLARTLSALRGNPGARESDLFIFSDGPRDSHDVQAVKDVRRVIRHIEGFGHISIREEPFNLGLAQSIIRGVTRLVEQYGHIIVLEDDLVVAPGFLSFMNQALSRFSMEPRVMQIAGNMFSFPSTAGVGDVFLSRKAASCGWATWSRAWRHFNAHSHELLAQIRLCGKQHAFDMDGTYPYFEHLTKAAEGHLDVWGVRWHASMFLKQGLCLYSTLPLVSNIGMDGSGMHCEPTTAFDVSLSSRTSWNFSVPIEESSIGLEIWKHFAVESQQRMRPSVMRRIARTLRRFAKC
ncbi:MAG: glycosyltransferase [Nitrospira sp.]|nr:glycosyltransferase [Nitrospira sp.]